MEDEAATNRSVWNVQHWLLSSIRKIKALKFSTPVAEKEGLRLARDAGRPDARCCSVCNAGCVGVINHQAGRRWSVLLIKSPFQGRKVTERWLIEVLSAMNFKVLFQPRSPAHELLEKPEVSWCAPHTLKIVYWICWCTWNCARQCDIQGEQDRPDPCPQEADISGKGDG